MNALTFIFKEGSLRLMIGPSYEARGYESIDDCCPELAQWTCGRFRLRQREAI